MIETFKRLDIFTQPIQFNSVEQTTKKNNFNWSSAINYSFTFFTNLFDILQLSLFEQLNRVRSQAFMDKNYKNQFIVMDSSEVIISEFKIQLQNTEVIEGSFIQLQYSFSSPVSFEINQLSMDYQKYSRNEDSKYISCALFDVDEQVQFTQIKYPTCPEVLAICNSTFALLMCLGYMARNLLYSLFKEQMLVMYMENIFQGNYLNILQTNKILNPNTYQSTKQEDLAYSQQDENPNQIFIPYIKVKQRESLLIKNSISDLLVDKTAETRPDRQTFYQNLKKKLNAYSNSKFVQQIHKVLLKFKIRNKEDYQISKGLNPKTKQLVQEQINKSLDFIDLQKELMFLKKAIMILLSKDQYAMIPLIGCLEKIFDLAPILII
ncbi:hypothetical protein ABPG72_017555 [Tetrahymena utriculariae]